MNREFSLSVRENILYKEAQGSNTTKTALSLFKIIQFLFYRVPEKDRRKYFARVRGKITHLSPAGMGVKTMPPSSVIGQSISITKNLLNGLNPAFIKQVLVELTSLLATMPPPESVPREPGVGEKI